MQQHGKELEELNIRVVVVSFESGFFARAYVEDTGIEWPLLVDENRELYKAYGMLAASFLDIWGPAVWWAYLKEMARGRFPKKTHGDISQRGGDVLVDPDGIVRMHHVARGPADRPSVSSILARVSKLKPEGRANHSPALFG